MNRNVVSILGIAGAVLVAALVALAGSDAGMSVQGVPVFAICIVIAFVIQWLVFVPAFVYQTEKYFDLTGSLTYITLTLLVWLGAEDVSNLSFLIGTLVLVWAVRLGSFLFQRVLMSGEDRRFRSIKPDFLQFLMTWTLQGLWVSLTYAAGLAAMTSESEGDLGVVALIGLAIWIAGFAIEVIADSQKSRFRADADNRNRFITSGLWRYSRHPNYFGEILLWIGIAVIAIPALSGWQLATLISPVFVTVLLTKISGVRMLEARAEKQWGSDPEYLAYKEATPVLIPYRKGS